MSLFFLPIDYCKKGPYEWKFPNSLLQKKTLQVVLNKRKPGTRPFPNSLLQQKGPTEWHFPTSLLQKKTLQVVLPRFPNSGTKESPELGHPQ